MRRFLTLVCLLCVAIPAGISITGCVRNPAGKYCAATSGYGLLTTQVASIIMQPEIGGISMAYGQTRQASAPSAYTCTGAGATVNSSSYAYGTTNNQLVDISPTGNICAGTWNRNTGGGIANYTICNFPNPLPSTGGLPYGVAYITAAADSVTSNPVPVYVHAPVTSVNLVGPTACLSQGQTAQLDAQAYYSLNGAQTLLCAPGSSTVPDCSASIGTLSFAVGTSSVASINATTNVITAEQPGTTVITASIAGSGSSAGYFSTCPPASIKTTLSNGNTSGTITQGVQQNLTTSVLDTNGNPITGLTLDYQSTNPIDITAGTTGAITSRFPGQASITAICQPQTCNPAPINELGLNGTGLSISSNAVNVTTPGTASNFVWFGAPGDSQYFVPIEVLTGTIGSTVRLPYVPNSMMMDQGGSDLYFGSPHELMIYSAATNTITKQDTSAPGVVLAVSPNNSQLLINDQARHLFYLYNASGGGFTTFGGMGEAAAWTPDSQTLYIVDNAELNTPTGCSGQPAISGHSDMLYVYNSSTGWSTYPLPPSTLPASVLPTCSTQPNTAATAPIQTPAITVPGVGAYLRGDPTTAHTWCPSGTVGNSASMQFYPLGDSVNTQTDVLAATQDGQHILGAAMMGGGITLSDIGVTIPTQNSGGVNTPLACPTSTTGSGSSQVQTLLPLTIAHTLTQTPLAQVNATAVNQMVTAPVSDLTFITYTGSTAGALLPYYLPGSNGAAGTLSYVTLNGSASITAPLAGAFSPDNTTFFVSTAGDNAIHFIKIPTNVSASAPPTDTQQVSPNLPACTPVSAGGVDAGCTYSGSGTVVPATVITVVPRSTT